METACPVIQKTPGKLAGERLAAHPNHSNWDVRTNGINASLPDALFNDRDPKYSYKYERPWHRAAIAMAQNGATIREIAAALEVTPNGVSTVLRQPWARQRMIQEIKQNAKDELHSMIERAAKDSFLRIIAIAEDPKTAPSVKLSANQEILNRFLGKPTQPISSGTENLTGLSDKELERIATSGRGASPPPSDSPEPD